VTLSGPFGSRSRCAGRAVGDDALEVMTTGTRGYPFLIQLVGAQTWRLHPSETDITVGRRPGGRVEGTPAPWDVLVYEPALAGASAIDKTFLLAMTKDDGPSKMADIQERLGVDVNYASQYRLRLIAASNSSSRRATGMWISPCRCCTSGSTSADEAAAEIYGYLRRAHGHGVGVFDEQLPT
jgi:hypothetical protein